MTKKYQLKLMLEKKKLVIIDIYFHLPWRPLERERERAIKSLHVMYMMQIEK